MEMRFLRNIYIWLLDVSVFEHLQQKLLNLKNVEKWKHNYGFDGKGIQDTASCYQQSIFFTKCISKALVLL